MFKWISVTTSLVGLVASVGLADVSVHLSPEDLCSCDGEQPLDIVVTANPGTDQALGAVFFDFDTAGDAWNVLNPSAFEWVPEIMNDPFQWFVTTDLPAPEAVAFLFSGAVDVPDGADVAIASLTVDPIGEPGVYSLGLSLQVFDANVGDLVVKDGDPARFGLDIPEPGSLILLATGALAVIHRRR